MNRILLVPLVALGAAACTEAPEPPAAAEAPTSVTLHTAAVREIPRFVEAGGVVRARTTAVITSRIVAPVRSIDVKPGERVKAGQILVRLDDRDLRANQARAAAAVTAAQQGAAAAEADRDAADAALVLARATHDRVAALHARRSATPQELDEAVAALSAAEARARLTRARVDELAASLDSARAAADAAAIAASFAVIAAPFDGVVTEKLLDDGNLASPGVALLRIEDIRGFTLHVHVDESRAVQIEPGDVVDVILSGPSETDAESPVTWAGRVAEVSLAVDAGSHAFLVKIDLPSVPGLRSGAFARARFATGRRHALALPRSAVVQQGQLPTVFVAAASGRAQMRVLNTGETAGKWVEILAGIAPGELVVLSPPPALRDGDPIRASTLPASGDAQ